MKNKIISKCPICDNQLEVTELKCKTCDTTIKGLFKLSRFDYLTPAQQEFALVFFKNAGNIKMIEKELNISYPTVKKNIEDVQIALGFDKNNSFATERTSKEEIYGLLKNKTITFEEAEEMLGGLDDE